MYVMCMFTRAPGFSPSFVHCEGETRQIHILEGQVLLYAKFAAVEGLVGSAVRPPAFFISAW